MTIAPALIFKVDDTINRAAASISAAIAVEGQPMPVDVTATRSPRRVPAYVLYSRFWAMCSRSSNSAAINSQRPGSPGRNTYRPTSPCRRPMWCWRSDLMVMRLAHRGRGLPASRVLVTHRAATDLSHVDLELHGADEREGIFAHSPTKVRGKQFKRYAIDNGR